MSKKLRIILLSLCWPGAFLAAACGETEGQVVTVEVALEAPGSPGSFTTTTGWEVHLEEARIAIGPLFAFAPRFEGGVVAALRSFLMPKAHAHGGTDPLNGRRVRAEWLPQVPFDALATDPLVLGTIEAESGAVDAVTVTLNPPDPGNATTMHDHHFWVRGEATKDGATIRFEGGLDIPDEGLSRRVENIPIDASLDEGGRWTVTVRASEWFQDAQFDRLTQQNAEGVFLITPESQVRSAWLLGARSMRAYAARFDLEEVR
ncbi:MAG: hypothetical protein WCE62_18200 [Polyangiales bacterium]